ncbi:uncharacterized protein ACMZJ9_008794, partial [Mantella aurantiaca]
MAGAPVSGGLEMAAAREMMRSSVFLCPSWRSVTAWHEDLIDMKFEVKEEEEETFVGGDQQSTEEDLEMVIIDPEESPIKISTGHAMEKPSKDHLTLSPGCKMEDEDITGEKTMISSMDGGDHSVDRSWDPSDQHRTV